MIHDAKTLPTTMKKNNNIKKYCCCCCTVSSNGSTLKGNDGHRAESFSRSLIRKNEISSCDTNRVGVFTQQGCKKTTKEQYVLIYIIINTNSHLFVRNKSMCQINIVQANKALSTDSFFSAEG